MIYWEPLTNCSLAVNLDDLAASIPFSASQVKTVEVETFLLSSQGSRTFNLEKSSIVYSFLVSALDLPNLRNQTRKHAQDRSKLYATLLSVAITSVKRSTPSLSRFAPHHSRLSRPWSPSSSVPRPYVAMTSLYPRFPRPYSRRRDRVS
jgi:hypothetical protein